MNVRTTAFTAMLILFLPGIGQAGGLGFGAMVQGASRGLQDVEDRRAGRYDDIRRRQEQAEYDRQMAEHRRLQEQRAQEELRLLRERNDLLQYRILQEE